MSGFRPLWEAAPAVAGFTPLKAEVPAAEGEVSFRPLVGMQVESSAPPPEPAEVEEAPEAPPELEPEEATANEVVVADEAPADVGILKAREEGYAAGREEGLAAGQAAIAEQVERLSALAEQLEGLRRTLFEQSVEDLGRAVRLVSEQVLRRELVAEASTIDDLVLDLLQHVRGDDEVIIRIAPEDEGLVQDAAPEMLDVLGRNATFRIELDETLTPGGARIETHHGSIDATVESRFEAYAETVSAWVVGETGYER